MHSRIQHMYVPHRGISQPNCRISVLRIHIFRALFHLINFSQSLKSIFCASLCHSASRFALVEFYFSFTFYLHMRRGFHATPRWLKPCNCHAHLYDPSAEHYSFFQCMQWAHAAPCAMISVWKTGNVGAETTWDVMLCCSSRRKGLISRAGKKRR